jgi:hypothetical protein
MQPWPKPTLQELTHGFRRCRGKGSLSMLLGGFEVSGAPMQVGQYRVPKVGSD